MTYQFFMAAAALALASITACVPAGQAILSESASDPIAIDGDLADWAGLLAPAEDSSFSLGGRHDGQRLYLALASEDQNFHEEVVRRGLIPWFDAEGGRNRNSGIRFPLGMTPLHPAAEMRSGGGHGERPLPIRGRAAAFQGSGTFLFP